jgi:signal transduction histidine kinase
MSTNKRFSSLRNKLVWPFALLGFSVSAILSLITLAIVADLETRNIERILLVELEDFRSRKQRNPAALPISTQLIRGYFLPVNERPEFDDLFADTDELTGKGFKLIKRRVACRPATIVVDEVEGDLLAIVHDDTSSRRMMQELAWLMIAATAFMTLLSALLGHRLAGQVVRPILRLLVELDERSKGLRWPDEFAPLFASGEYPRNEIGRLALALDAFARRLHGFVLRERHFAGDVSHELRTPIAIIRGAAEVARELPDLPAPVRARIDLIQRKAARLGELLDALLLLARERELGPSAGDAVCALAEVIEEAVAECRTLIADKNVLIECQFKDRPLLPVERSMAYVVVSNLLRNACMHTPKGQVTVTLNSDALEISDTGVGIPADRFPHIFNRFVKGEDSPGAGIGLSIVARMVEVMAWTVAIESEPGQGTTVRVQFVPMSPPEI